MAAFWAATPREFHILFDAYERRRGWAAYHAGAPGWAKDRVSLEQMMGIAARPVTQGRGAEGMRRSLELWDAVWAAKGMLVDETVAVEGD